MFGIGTDARLPAKRRIQTPMPDYHLAASVTSAGKTVLGQLRRHHRLVLRPSLHLRQDADLCPVPPTVLEIELTGGQIGNFPRGSTHLAQIG